MEELRRLFDKYVLKMLEFINANCKQLIPIAELNGVASLCRLFDALGTVDNGVSIEAFLFSFACFFLKPRLSPVVLPCTSFVLGNFRESYGSNFVWLTAAQV